MPRYPIVGGDDNAWGDVLNQLLEVSIDSDGTLAPLAVAGAVHVATQSVAATASIDWAVGPIFDITMTGNTTFAFANLTLGLSIVVTLRGAHVPTWPTVAWQPSAPAYTDSGTGMSFEFWVTETGEVRGAAITGIAAGTYDAYGTSAAETTRAKAAEALLAPLASPALTGTPTAPSPPDSDSTTKIATTAWVQEEISDLTAAVSSVTAADGTLTVTPTTGAVTAKIPSAVALPGAPTTTTATALDNSTKIATTAYADAAVGVETTRAETAEALLAPLASPALTGNPTAPTQTTGNNTTRLASTAFVQAAAGLLVPASTFTAAGQLLISTGSGTYEALTAPSEIGQSPVKEGSDASTVQWGYSRSLRDRYLSPSAALAETVPEWMVNAAQVMGGTGLVSFYAIALPKGLTVSNITFRAAATAANGPQHWWYVLANSSLALLAETADQTSTAFGASADHTLAVATIASGASSTFVTTYEGLHYVGIMMAVSTTMPTLAGYTMSSGGLGNVGTPRKLGVSSDGVATGVPGFPHTFGSIGTTLVGYAYCYVS